MPAFISTIKNVLGIHGIATKSGDFSPNLLENKNLEKKSIACCHRNTVFDAMFGEMLIFFGIWLQILTKFFRQLVLLSLEFNHERNQKNYIFLLYTFQKLLKLPLEPSRTI